MKIALPSTTTPTDLEEQFIQRVFRASVTVLGDSPTGRAVRQLCESHLEARRAITTDRTAGTMVVAVVGATGQGKSWLMRQFVRSQNVATAIRSGNNLDEATERITWVGPMPPSNLDVRYEQYLHCDSQQMVAMGTPYLLVDSPGATDDRRDVAETSRLALSMASILLMVVRRDQLRSHALDLLAAASEGSLVVPVVNAVQTWDDAARADTDAFVARLRRAAPLSQVTTPVAIPDFETGGRDEASVGAQAVQAIQHALKEELSSNDALARTGNRLVAMDARFRSALHATLHAQLPSLAQAIQRLNDEARALPEQIAASLVGGGTSLRTAIRARLRADLMTDTSSLWFPYRTLLGLLCITSGAWDRVVLSLTGSLPSLISATYTGITNVRQAGASAIEVRDGIRQRSAAAVSDRLGPLAARFRREIHLISGNRGAGAADSSVSRPDERHERFQPASLAGIDSLQEQSQEIFEEEIERACARSTVVNLCAMFGTGLFWILMAGPISTLYRNYLQACLIAIRDFQGDLSQFPRLELSMLLTSLLLSILPTAIFAMFVVSWVQGRRRVDQAEQAIRDRHRSAIASLQQQQVLRLEWDDALLADAEFLLTAGLAHSPSLSGSKE